MERREEIETAVIWGFGSAGRACGRMVPFRDSGVAHQGMRSEQMYRCIEREKMHVHKAGSRWKSIASEANDWADGGKSAQDRLDQ
jgi:hypothetical protein